MSIAALTTVAAVRDQRPPKKQDAGKKAADKAAEPASLTDLLITQIPTELVAPYTAVTAGIVGAIAKPSAGNLHPGQLQGLRWVAFAILLAGTVLLVWEGKRRKAGAGNSFPLLEVSGALVGATGWALAMPGSPLTPYLHGTDVQTAVPLLIAFAAVVVSVVTAGALQSKRNSAT